MFAFSFGADSRKNNKDKNDEILRVGSKASEKLGGRPFAAVWLDEPLIDGKTPRMLVEEGRSAEVFKHIESMPVVIQ
jgi:hypothetical protein